MEIQEAEAESIYTGLKKLKIDEERPNHLKDVSKFIDDLKLKEKGTRLGIFNGFKSDMEKPQLEKIIFEMYKKIVKQATELDQADSEICSLRSLNVSKDVTIADQDKLIAEMLKCLR